nr:hypothetical protein [uncultured Halomonas sp.]
MIKYIPFLKLKTNEIKGVAQLTQAIRDQIVPLYDIARSKQIMSEPEIIERLRIAHKELKKSQAIVPSYSFFIDNFDIDDSIDLLGTHQYRAILAKFAEFPIIPILAFDRQADHNAAALDFIEPKLDDIAIRLQQADIESYNLTKLKLSSIWPALQAAQPRKIILLIDLRIIEDSTESAKQVSRFLARFNQDFQADVIAVTGSIIPGNIATLIATDEEKHVLREEYRLWRSLQSLPGGNAVLYGDYCVVSPEYSDIDLAPELMNGISTPKVFYPYGDYFYVARGRRFRSHSYNQYFDISDSIVNQHFYRGSAYSYGDQYIYDRSHLSAKKPAKAGSPSTWIKSTTAAHITFIVNTI